MSTLRIDIEGPEWFYGHNDVEIQWDEILLSHYKRVEALVQRVIETDGDHFVARVGPSGNEVVVALSSTGKNLMRLLGEGCYQACSQLKVFGLNYYVKAYHEAVTHCEGMNFTCTGRASYTADQLNCIVEFIRGSIDRDVLVEVKNRQNRAKAKRLKSASQYIDSIRKKHSRINCLRIDFSYRKGKFLESEDYLGDLNVVKAHWEKLRLDLDRGIPISGKIGFVARLEYGVLTGFHFHALIILDGSKRQQDISLAQVIGEHWVNEIVPNGEGRYFNCNRHKNSYYHLGIGTINYYEDSKYAILKDIVLNYMVKTDLLMDTIAPGERSMFRGKLRQMDCSGRGRPRCKTVL